MGWTDIDWQTVADRAAAIESAAASVGGKIPAGEAIVYSPPVRVPFGTESQWRQILDARPQLATYGTDDAWQRVADRARLNPWAQVARNKRRIERRRAWAVRNWMKPGRGLAWLLGANGGMFWSDGVRRNDNLFGAHGFLAGVVAGFGIVGSVGGMAALLSSPLGIWASSLIGAGVSIWASSEVAKAVDDDAFGWGLSVGGLGAAASRVAYALAQPIPPDVVDAAETVLMGPGGRLLRDIVTRPPVGWNPGQGFFPQPPQ